MKFTTIVCTECNEPREVSGHVDLPYTCADCRAAEEFNKATAPAAGGTTRAACEPVYHVGDPGDEHQESHVHNADGGDCCAGATTEATNDLIANLEEDLATYESCVSQAADHIEELSGRIKELTDDLAVERAATEKVADLAVNLVCKNLKLYRELADSDAEIKEGCEALEMASEKLKQATGAVQRLESENAELMKFARRAIARAHLFEDEAAAEANFYRTQGFFGRLFRVRYKG